MTQKNQHPKKLQNLFNALNALNALHLKNVPDRPPPPPKKKVMEENALNVLHLKNVPGRPPPPKKKKKEIKKRRKTKISPIPHEKLRCRNERRLHKGRFSFRSVDFFTNILLIEIMIANPNRLRILRKDQKTKTGSGRRRGR